MDEGQGKCSLLKGLVPRVVVAQYEDNAPRNKNVRYKFVDGNGNGNAAATIAIPLHLKKKKSRRSGR
jgi:hypothetical protein